MSKTRVFIYGSCVSRDTFEHMDPNEFELIQYVARQSALSAYTRPVDSVTPPVLESRFQQRMVTGDFASSLRSLIPQAAESTDLLLVDLVDERLGVYLLPDGSVVTRSVELIESGAERSLPPGTQHIAFGTQQHFEYWSAAINAVGELVRTSMPRAAVALLDIPWAEWSESGEPTPDSFGVTATQANPVFRAYVDVAVQALGAHLVRLHDIQVTSGPQHPWGDAPFHYAEGVYIEAVRRLTGAPGRTVWPPEAARQQVPTPSASTPVADRRAHSSTHSFSSGSVAVDGDVNPTIALLTTNYWRYRRSDGSTIAAYLRFNPDGSVWGSRPKTESSWEVEGDRLTLKMPDGTVASEFGGARSADGGYRFEGESRRPTKADRFLILESTTIDWRRRPRPANSTRKLLAEEIKRHKWKIGDHTYGKPEIVGSGRATLKIGKYCWFDPTAQLVLTRRRLDGVSLYSFHSTRGSWPSGNDHKPETTAGPIRIGNDVRVEAGAIIHAGVTIGDGAYIGPNAVISEDVPPYAIVEGNPGRVVGMRFPEAQVAGLLDIAWWNWTDADVDEALAVMAQGIDAFFDHVRRRQG